MRRLLSLLALTLLFAGCASDKFTFSRYSGSPREWPTDRESLAEEGKGYEIPVYRTWPDKPYEVLGSIRHKYPYRWWNDGTIKDVSKMAKKNGGAAMVIRYGEEYGVSAVVTEGRERGTRNKPAVTALVIRFMSEEKIQERERAEAERRKQMSAYWQDWEFRNPTAKFSEDARDVVVKYLASMGVSPASEDFRKQLDDILQRISRRQPEGSLAGEWICKAHVRSGGIASATEKDYFGIVSVEQAGQNLSILSKAGNLELTFTGKNQENAVAGSLGIAGVLAKAEGVASDDKISLTFITQLPNGTAQGNVAIQRASAGKSK